jgi:ribosomal protein S12 methylthiotransferase accessory factor
MHRVVAPADTLRRIKPLARKAGVTRLANITGLDRIGIPTYSAVVPKSRDLLSTYNGKGATRTDAACGALMEAIERQSALNLQRPVVRASYRKISRRERALDPKTMALKLDSEYTDDLVLSWVDGYDICSNEPVKAPATAAGYMLYEGYGPPCFDIVTSTGLASGNTMEEAICHALCELIERDAWTLAELLAHCLPLWKYQQQPNVPTGVEFQDDQERYPEVDLDGADAVIRGMLRQFSKAGLTLIVKDITSDLGVPSIMASSQDCSGPVPLAHLGFGAHPDPRVAVSRAISELAQSRAVDIQGVREDLSGPDEPVPAYMHHVQRVDAIDRSSWYHCRTRHRRKLGDIGGAIHGDILDDIRFMLERLKVGGLHQAIVVDLTDAELGIPVVRVFVPGLESWAADQSRIGWRADGFWQAHAEE